MALQLLFLWVGRTYGDKRYQILVFVAYLHIAHTLYSKMRTNVQTALLKPKLLDIELLP